MKDFTLPTSANTYSIQNYKYVSKVHAIMLAFNLYNIHGEQNNLIKFDIVHYLFEPKYTMVNSSIPILCSKKITKIPDIVDFIKFGLLVKVIEDSLSSYEKALHNFLEKMDDHVNPRDLGIISSIPKYYYQLKEREYFDGIIETVKNSGNEYYGRVGNREDFVLTLVSKRLANSATYNKFWVINALNSENKLFTYFDSRDVIKNVEVKNNFKIRATIKKHNFSTFLKCKETQLTRISYV
jgi:hypothetical protein